MRKKRKAQIWFDKSCYQERKDTLQALAQAKSTGEQEDLTKFATKRRRCKSLIKTKRSEYVEREAKRLAKEGEKDPYSFQKKRPSNTSREIPTEKWEMHFSQILNKQDIGQAYVIDTNNDHREEMATEITKEKIEVALRKAKKQEGNRTRPSSI